MFDRDWSCLRDVKLHLPASKFQIKVWEALLRIPMGLVASYGDIAQRIGQPSAARAVGTAIANNPVAFDTLPPSDKKEWSDRWLYLGVARKQATLVGKQPTAMKRHKNVHLILCFHLKFSETTRHERI